jgi:short-subunit dehydrogenase
MTKCWFDYKTVIVTGASSGIGKLLSEKLIRDHGCNVIGIARTESKLAAFKEDLGQFSHKFTYFAFDVSDKDKWTSLAAELEEKGIQVDILINNAGILPKFDRFENYSLDEIDKAMQINFYSAVYSMNALMPHILKSDCASIINVASSAALCSLAGTSVYSASKAALKSFTDAVREETRGRCYIGLICPGFTKTDIFRSQKESSSNSQKAMDMVSTSCDRMVRLIIDHIWNKKEDSVFGVDAHLMDIGNKLCGTLCSNIAGKVMKLSGLEMFRDIFTDKKN